MAAAVADVAEVDGEVVAGLPLDVEGEVFGVGELVVDVVGAEGKGLGAVDDAGGVGEVFAEVGGVAGGRGGGGGAEGVGELGAGGRSDGDDEGRLLGDAEGTADAAAGAGGEVGEELAAIVVEADAAADDDFVVEHGG